MRRSSSRLTGHYSAGVKRKPYGNPVCVMKHGFKHFIIEDTQGNQVCKIRKTRSFGKKAVECTVTNKSTGQSLLISMKGDFFARKAGVFVRDKNHSICIAKLLHPLTVKKVLLGKDEYFVEIAPGVDSSFIVLMCLLFDKISYETGIAGKLFSHPFLTMFKYRRLLAYLFPRK